MLEPMPLSVATKKRLYSGFWHPWESATNLTVGIQNCNRRKRIIKSRCGNLELYVRDVLKSCANEHKPHIFIFMFILYLYLSSVS